MKKMMFFIGILFLLIVSGCQSEKDSAMEDSYSDYNSNIDDGGYSGSESSKDAMEGGNVADSADTPTLENRKIIYTVDLEMSSLDANTLYSDVLDSLNDYSAYVESENITLEKYEITIRVLSNNLMDFVDSIKGDGYIVSYSKSSEDITNSYSTYQARLTALNAKLVRLNELYETASVDDILEIEQEITDTMAEITEMGLLLESYDSLIEYSTVNLVINNVSDLDNIYPNTRDPYVTLNESTKNSLLIEIENRDDEDVTLYVVVEDNGKEVKTYEIETGNNSTYLLEITDLESYTDYRISVTALAKNHSVSYEYVRTYTTDITYSGKTGMVFSASINALVTVFEVISLVIVAILPFAFVGGVIATPIVYLIRKNKKSKE